ncbi:MAG TPA: peptide chain release factor N(5)-glutamine methyltransferase [Candidatus Sulfotelmatobacter sp.]
MPSVVKIDRVQLKEVLASAIARLTANNVPSPRLNAETLLMFTLNCDRAYLFAHPERELTADERARYESALAERARGVPAQYITGHQEFWGMDLIVSPAVLIPRPETEHLIEAVIDVTRVGGQECPLHIGLPHIGLPHIGLDSSSEVRGPRSDVRIVDVGTGSGCIALALAKEFPRAEIHATDISAAALDIARANAARLQLADRIQFHQTDLLEGIVGPFDFVISNPPYVGESEEYQVQMEVRKFEPRNAVFAGPTGLEVISRLIPQAHAALRPGGWLILEISGTIAEETKRLLSGWGAVRIVNDLQSIPRVVQARKPAG